MSARKKPTTNPALRALEHLDKGFPVEIGGMEYILMDKLYQRAPVYRGDELVDHRLLGVDMPFEAVLLKFSDEITFDEHFTLSASRTLSTHFEQRHSIFQMLVEARQLRGALLSRGPITIDGTNSVFDEQRENVTGPVEVCFTRGSANDLSYGPEPGYNQKGARIDRFEVYLAGLTAKSEQGFSHLSDITRCDVLLGVVDLEKGFVPNPALPTRVLKAAGLVRTPEAEPSEPSLG